MSKPSAQGLDLQQIHDYFKIKMGEQTHSKKQVRTSDQQTECNILGH